jgi:hypothetical protein
MERVGPVFLKSKSATGRRVIFLCFWGVGGPISAYFHTPPTTR